MFPHAMIESCSRLQVDLIRNLNYLNYYIKICETVSYKANQLKIYFATHDLPFLGPRIHQTLNLRALRRHNTTVSKDSLRAYLILYPAGRTGPRDNITEVAKQNLARG